MGSAQPAGPDPPAARRQGREEAGAGSAPGSALSALQRAAGNRATTLLVQRAVAVQRDLKSIEAELKRRFTDPDDPRLPARRAALGSQLPRLDDADSSTLVMGLLEPTRDSVVADRFQTLSAPVRFELLTVLFGRLGHVRAELLHASLTDRTKPHRSRFRELVPEPGRRAELLTVLSDQFARAHLPEPGKRLWVRWGDPNFRTSGPFSPDNHCDKSDFVGLGPDPNAGRNIMELRGDVIGHTPGTRYDIKRTIELGTWKRSGRRPWEPLDAKPAGSDDDAHDADENLTPEHSHLYSIDGPGPVPGGPDLGAAATAYVFSASFVEWVIAKVGSAGWERVSEDFEWHTSSALVRVNGRWQRDPNRPNDIAPGSQPILEPEP